MPYGSIVCSDNILSIEQEAHDEVLACEDAKVCNRTNLRQVAVRAELQDQFEKSVKRVGLVLVLLDDGLRVSVLIFRALIVAIFADFRLVTLPHPQVILVEGVSAVNELHLIGLDGPNHHLLI